MKQPTELYNNAYKKFTPDFLESFDVKKYFHETNETLINFYKSYKDQFNISFNNAIECGCGIGGMAQFFSSVGIESTGLDISPVAISIARSIQIYPGNMPEYRVSDLGKAQSNSQKYDLVFDSHLLHCITNSECRSRYYENVKNMMNQDSHFLIETMAYDKGVSFPLEYYFDEDSNINKQFDGEYTPIRRLMSPKELEQEFLEHGFIINYLYFHNELSFNPFTDYPNYSHQELPKTLRVGLKLK